MLNKKSIKNFNLLLTFGLLFSFIIQLISPINIYADTNDEEENETEDTAQVGKDNETAEDDSKEEVEESTNDLDDEIDNNDVNANDEIVELENVEEVNTTAEEGEFNPTLANEETAIDEGDGVYNLTVFHMNDTHARVENYPKLITAIKDYGATDPLTLHAGDVFSGTLYFTQHRGQADVALMNLMNLDAMVFGNHEFDLGSKENGQESLSKFVEAANFPFLGTNTDFSGDPFMNNLETNGEAIENADPKKVYNSIITEKNGEKIGILGLTTEDTANISSPMEVKFTNYLEAAQNSVDELTKVGVNKIVAVNHIGYDTGETIGSDRILAKQVEGIDIIVGGHSHTKLEEPVLIDEGEEPTIIVQAGQYAENLGTLEVTFDDTGKIIEHEGKLVPVKDLESDQEAAERLVDFKEEVDELNNEEIGAVAKKDLLNPRYGEGDSTSVRGDETELGNLVTDAMLAKVREKYPETDIAVQNGGGLRAPIMKGPITVGEVINVLPFGNDPVIVELSGKEIKEILEHSVKDKPKENGGFLHISGMRYYYDSEKEPQNRIVKMFILKNGREIEIKMDEMYLVTTNGFTGAGGDGFATFERATAEGRVRDTGEIDWEQLRDYMVEDLGGVVDPVIEGRIIDLEGKLLPEDEIKQLKERISKLEAALNNLEVDNEEVKDEITQLRKLLANLLQDLEAGDTRLDEIEKKIADLEARIAELKHSDSNDSEDPSEGSKNDEEKDKKPSGNNNQVDNDKKEESPESSDSKGGTLPKTGTNEYVYSIIGISLLTSGAVLFIIRRRKISKH